MKSNILVNSQRDLDQIRREKEAILREMENQKKHKMEKLKQKQAETNLKETSKVQSKVIIPEIPEQKSTKIRKPLRVPVQKSFAEVMKDAEKREVIRSTTSTNIPGIKRKIYNEESIVSKMPRLESRSNLKDLSDFQTKSNSSSLNPSSKFSSINKLTNGPKQSKKHLTSTELPRKSGILAQSSINSSSCNKDRELYQKNKSDVLKPKQNFNSSSFGMSQSASQRASNNSGILSQSGPQKTSITSGILAQSTSLKGSNNLGFVSQSLKKPLNTNKHIESTKDVNPKLENNECFKRPKGNEITKQTKSTESNFREYNSKMSIKKSSIHNGFINSSSKPDSSNLPIKNRGILAQSNNPSRPSNQNSKNISSRIGIQAQNNSCSRLSSKQNSQNKNGISSQSIPIKGNNSIPRKILAKSSNPKMNVTPNGILAQQSRGILAQSAYRGPIDQSSDEEYDSDLDGFIDDSEVDITDKIRKEIYSSLRYDPKQYAANFVSKYDDCKNMESSVCDINKEESQSLRAARKEDAMERKLEEARLLKKGKTINY